MTGNAGRKSRPSGRHSLERVHQREDGHRGLVPGQQVHMIVVPGELRRLHAGHATPVLRHEDQMNVEGGNYEPAAAPIPQECHRSLLGSGFVQVRYRYRIYPAPSQQRALARVFGCARVVYNDCLKLRDACHAGRTFARIGRFEPTSQVCSACGANDGPKPLHVRAWACAACGTLHDRDVNAARNILAAGRADKSNACGGQVRPARLLAPAGEAGTLLGAA
jgi:hypothetical protein